MRFLLTALRWLLTITVILCVIFAALLFMDRQPVVEQDHAITAAERAWAHDWLSARRSGKPQAGKLITLALSERETTVLANVLIERLGQGRATVHLENGRAQIMASINPLWNPLGSFINLQLTLVEQEHLPQIDTVRLAGLPLPGTLAQALAKRALDAATNTRMLRQVDFRNGQMQIAYEWQPDLLERFGSGLVDAADRVNLLRYQDALTQEIAEFPKGKPLSLADLLAYLLARAIAQPADADPVAENRALIQALAAYVNGQTIRDPSDSQTKSSHIRPVLLRGRQDLGQHFMTSAALTVQGNDTLSGMVGWYKEMFDANGGSGFSFADMAANRSGIRFAQLATASQDSARQVQRMAAAGLNEDDVMPTIDGLPEGMNQQMFTARFSGLNQTEYQTMIMHIDHRIDDCRLFRKSTR